MGVISYTYSHTYIIKYEKNDIIQSDNSNLRSNMIQYNTIQYNTIQYNTIQYNTIQYNTIQYNTIQIHPGYKKM